MVKSSLCTKFKDSRAMSDNERQEAGRIAIIPPVGARAAHHGRDCVNGLFQREAFTGFGSCRLEPDTVRPCFTARGRRPGRLREAVRRDCPRLPGVYGMIDGAGELIYVGKAKSLRSRLLSYFRPNSRDEKAGKIIKEARGLLWELADSEFAALLRELELIRRWQPRFNVQGQPHRRRRVYVCVGRRPAQYAFVAARPPSTALASFGPVPGVRRARESARRLNDWYRLRDCPQKQTMVFADQSELFPVVRAPGCIRHDIGHCLAPCAAACTHSDYSFHVHAALDFLEGRDCSPLEQLERERNAAADALQFERAAVLRDRHDALEWLAKHLERLRQAVRHSFVYPVANIDGSATWYAICGGVVRLALPAPEDAKDQVVREKLAEVYRPGTSPGNLPDLDEVDGVLLVAGWFRRHRDERARVIEIDSLLPLASPDEVTRGRFLSA
jgi:excinuclease ABC subunit C